MSNYIASHSAAADGATLVEGFPRRGRLDHRYAALLLLLVPWLILEPLKPFSIVLFTHKHHLSATLLIVGSEVIKLTLLEQIFDITKPKLLTFGWFAWGYEKWRGAVDYIHSLTVWRQERWPG